MMTQLVGWSFAGLSLVTEPSQRPASGWWLETYGDGWDLGEPEAQIVTRESLLLDGDDVVIDRYGNRQIPSTVVVCAYTNADLFAGHKALSIRIGQRASLTFTPPQSGPVSVFDVRASTMRYLGADMEFARPEGQVRHAPFQVTWHCAPWAYEAEEIEETFAPGAGTVTTVDGCTANTNWPGMTQTTYLSQSVVRLTSTDNPGSPGGGWVWNGSDAFGREAAVQGSSYLRVTYTGSVPAVTFVYLDVAIQGQAFNSFYMANTSTGTPIAFQALANGFTRYFWTRPSSGTVVLDVTAGDTFTINIDQFGTSTTLPSGSLFALNMRGSVRVYGQLVLECGGMGETFIYADPSMLTNGWQPDLDESWPNAPEGTYWLWVQPGLKSTGPNTAYASGDVIGVTVADQTQTTRTQWAGVTTVTNGRWFPIGPFYLGTNRTRRLGTITDLLDTMDLTCNGVTMAGSAKVRLIRADPSTALLHARLNETTHGFFFVDPPTFDQPRPGLYAGDEEDGSDAVSVLDVTDAWNWPVLQPPSPCLWVQTKSTAAKTLVLRSRPAHHTFVTDQQGVA